MKEAEKTLRGAAMDYAFTVLGTESQRGFKPAKPRALTPEEIASAARLNAAAIDFAAVALVEMVKGLKK